MLESDVGHPAEVSWVEIHLGGEAGVRSIASKIYATLTYSGKTLFADMRRWYRFFALKVDMTLEATGDGRSRTLVAERHRASSSARHSGLMEKQSGIWIGVCVGEQPSLRRTSKLRIELNVESGDDQRLLPLCSHYSRRSSTLTLYCRLSIPFPAF